MTIRNKYLKRSRISEAKFRELLRHFPLDLSAKNIAILTNLNRNTVNRYLFILRKRIAEYCEQHSPFEGEIMEGRKVGFAKILGNFFKNVASGLTLGSYTPEGEEKPHGGIGRIVYLFKKIFKDAIVDDIVMGVPRSMIYVGEDIMLAGLNTIEVIPDATIGNSKVGRKATTAIFAIRK